MQRNPTDIFEAGSQERTRPDADATRFVRLTIDVVGRILACDDLDPGERRAVLRYLIATRTHPKEQRAAAFLLIHLGLVAGAAIALPEEDRPAVVDLLSLRFTAGFSTPEVQALAGDVAVGLRAFLVLAWAVALVRAIPGQALPRLEDIDPDLPWMPPIGQPPTPPGFDARTALAQIETGEPSGGEPPVGYRRAGR